MTDADPIKAYIALHPEQRAHATTIIALLDAIVLQLSNDGTHTISTPRRAALVSALIDDLNPASCSASNHAWQTSSARTKAFLALKMLARSPTGSDALATDRVRVPDLSTFFGGLFLINPVRICVRSRTGHSRLGSSCWPAAFIHIRLINH